MSQTSEVQLLELIKRWLAQRNRALINVSLDDMSSSMNIHANSEETKLCASCHRGSLNGQCISKSCQHCCIASQHKNCKVHGGNGPLSMSFSSETSDISPKDIHTKYIPCPFCLIALPINAWRLASHLRSCNPKFCLNHFSESGIPVNQQYEFAWSRFRPKDRLTDVYLKNISIFAAEFGQKDLINLRLDQQQKRKHLTPIEEMRLSTMKVTCELTHIPSRFEDRGCESEAYDFDSYNQKLEQGVPLSSQISNLQKSLDRYLMHSDLLNCIFSKKQMCSDFPLTCINFGRIVNSCNDSKMKAVSECEEITSKMDEEVQAVREKVAQFQKIYDSMLLATSAEELKDLCDEYSARDQSWKFMRRQLEDPDRSNHTKRTKYSDELDVRKFVVL